MAANNPYDQASQNSGPTLVPPQGNSSAGNPAADLIRQKLAGIYGDEPNAAQEIAEAKLPGIRHSKHQQYMLQLNNSGRPTNEVQAAWHQYYLSLNDYEKHEVWQEFYDQSAQAKQQASRLTPQYQYNQPNPQATNVQQAMAAAPAHQPASIYPTPTALEQPSFGRPPLPQAAEPISTPAPADAAHNPLLGGVSTATPSVSHSPQDATAADITTPETTDDRPADAIRHQIRDKVRRSKPTSSKGVKHHVQSLLFGLGFGALAILVTLFGFFNEVVVAPFIQPSRSVSATPIIISPDGITASDKNEVIIPKINVEIPLDFSAKTTNEKEFEAALDKGVAHYPTTALPGQTGNTSFFGHSSNNIFNPGKYKFAFVLLNQLVPGDTFYITYNGVAYAYAVYDKKIVEATEVSILKPVAGRASTAMLVTCDPPGTSLRRLVVWGEQISPNPTANVASTAQPTASDKSSDSALPGNGPTLWGRIREWVSGS